MAQIASRPFHNIQPIAYEGRVEIKDSRELLSLGITHNVIDNAADRVGSMLVGLNNSKTVFNSLWQLCTEVSGVALPPIRIVRIQLWCGTFGFVFGCTSMSVRVPNNGCLRYAIMMTAKCTESAVPFMADIFDSKNISYYIASLGGS